jgi:hypothetical protein
VDPGSQTRRIVADLDSAAIDEGRGQLVLWIGTFCVAAMVREVIDRGVALKDQFAAHFLHDAAEVAGRRTLAAPCFGERTD